MPNDPTPSAGSDARYRKKPVVIEAHQWFKNGDHPEDHSWTMTELQHYHGVELPNEGRVVRYFRNPAYGDNLACGICQRKMLDHGWIDTLEAGHRVCPGDWIITGVKGEYYPCKPDIFALTYEPESLTASDSLSGWRLVPIEPTEEIFEAAMKAHSDDFGRLEYPDYFRKLYIAMIEAAPTPSREG